MTAQTLTTVEEILKYYLSTAGDAADASQYHELAHAVTRIQNPEIRTKMETLLDADASRERISKAYECEDYEDFVQTYKVKPPTERLKELYDDVKLARVLAGMAENKALPAIKVRFSSGGPFEYEVVDGIHRYYASVKHGFAKLPVVLAG